MFIFKFVLNWTAAMCWHLWRVATGRPHYAGIADTGFAAASFVLVFTAGVVLRWSALADLDAGVVALRWLITLMTAAVIGLRRSGQNSSLFCVILACSAVVDLLASSIALIAQDMDLLGGHAYMLMEVALYLRSIKVFSELPASIRAAGYRRHSQE